MNDNTKVIEAAKALFNNIPVNTDINPHELRLKEEKRIEAIQENCETQLVEIWLNGQPTQRFAIVIPKGTKPDIKMGKGKRDIEGKEMTVTVINIVSDKEPEPMFIRR